MKNFMKKQSGELLLMILLSFFFSCFTLVNAQTFQFHQLNFDYNGTITNNSAWGAVDVTFTGSPGTLYLNLSNGADWVIQNMPVLTTRGTGNTQTQRFWFPIGPPGVPVTNINYGISLTPVLAPQPFSSLVGTVTPDQVSIHTGFSGNPPGGGVPGPAVNQVGGAVADPNPPKHENFPNQESPWNYCVPVGVSNSLQWLNDKNSLGMPADKISIGAMAAAFGTTAANGTWRNTIYPDKKAHCKNNKLPITTHKAGGSQIAQVAKEIKNGQDVEMMIGWAGTNNGHCVAVTGITDLGNGKYTLLITHDKEQDQAGGTVDETATYDLTNETWSGALSNADGDPASIDFLIECPVVSTKFPTCFLPGGILHRTISDARTTYLEGQFQIENLVLSGYTNSDPLPPLGQTALVTFTGQATFDLSPNGGLNFQGQNAVFQAVAVYHHTLDSAGRAYCETELLQLSISGGSLPPMMGIRESPTLPSTGVKSVSPVPGGWRIGSFFDIFTELSFDGGSSWTPDDNESSVLFAQGLEVLPQVPLQNILVESGHTECYDATETILVAGPGTSFTVLNGGSVTLIAGQSIHLFEGTQIFPGGYLHAYIAPGGPWCSGTMTGGPPALPSAPVFLDDELTEEPDQAVRPFFTLYPNPTGGEFTIELTGESPAVDIRVQIFGSRGEIILARSLTGSRKYDFSLAGKPAGIYFIRVTSGNSTEMVKVVKITG
jgi:hypothetical protein